MTVLRTRCIALSVIQSHSNQLRFRQMCKITTSRLTVNVEMCTCVKKTHIQLTYRMNLKINWFQHLPYARPCVWLLILCKLTAHSHWIWLRYDWCPPQKGDEQWNATSFLLFHPITTMVGGAQAKKREVPIHHYSHVKVTIFHSGSFHQIATASIRQNSSALHKAPTPASH